MYAAMYKKKCVTASSLCKKINIYDNPAFTPLPVTEDDEPVIDLFYYATKPCNTSYQIPIYHQPYYIGYPTPGMPPSNTPYMPPSNTSYMPPSNTSYMPPNNPYIGNYSTGNCTSCTTRN
jgi:hypothetical protein